MHANLFASKRAGFLNATDEESLNAAFELAKLEGIIPALESAHALAAFRKIKFEKSDVVVVNLSGRGDNDMDTYMRKLIS
jgi:tryptophan synthase beta chain